MTDLLCPRCAGDSLTLNLQVFATFSFTAGVRTTTSIDDDGEGFMSLACDSCSLTLSGAAGDGRMRRATLIDPETGIELDDDSFEARMIEIADALSRVAAA